MTKGKSSDELSQSVIEKPTVDVYAGKALRDSENDLPTFSKQEQGSLLRKMDVNIVPFLALLYLYVHIHMFS